MFGLFKYSWSFRHNWFLTSLQNFKVYPPPCLTRALRDSSLYFAFYLFTPFLFQKIPISALCSHIYFYFPLLLFTSLPPTPSRSFHSSITPSSSLILPPFALLSPSLSPYSTSFSPPSQRVAQSIARVTPGEEVPGSIPAVAARSLLVGSVSV